VVIECEVSNTKQLVKLDELYHFHLNRIQE
jgi:hypothetical protein